MYVTIQHPQGDKRDQYLPESCKRPVPDDRRGHSREHPGADECAHIGSHGSIAAEPQGKEDHNGNREIYAGHSRNISKRDRNDRKTGEHRVDEDERDEQDEKCIGWFLRGFHTCTVSPIIRFYKYGFSLMVPVSALLLPRCSLMLYVEDET